MVFYGPDVAAIPGHAEVLAGSALFIGDGASINRPLLRRHDGVLLGHAPIRTQLGWCRDAGIARAVFTHCGSEIVGGDERRLGAKVRALAREYGVSARIAYDGLRSSCPETLLRARGHARVARCRDLQALSGPACAAPADRARRGQ